jgi:predicted metalloprotease with PDZ domain
MPTIFPQFLLILALLTGLSPVASAITPQSRFDLHEVAWHMTPASDGESVAMEMRLAPLFERPRLVVRIPLWRPGSYRYANYQDRIHDLKAIDQDGQELAILKLTPRAWEIDTRGVSALKVQYQLSATNEADEGAMPAMHLRSPMTFLYSEDSKDLPHSLTVDLPKGWDFASGHRLDATEPGVRRSPNYDVFIDCPIALGDLERHSFVSHGITIEWVLFGRKPTEAQFPREEWSRKLKAMVEVCYEIFGDYPFERYVFLFLMNGIGGISGLEHLNSTSILANHRGIKSGQMLEPLESVTAHEFFHLWNVKRIRPQQLGPFDYATDVRTTDLWWLEGITSYYNDIIVQRAEMRAEGWFWQSQSNNFYGTSRSPGFGKVSAERSSWTEWDPDRKNYISYYNQGQMLGLLLDVKIRLETQNQRSLDDVLAFLARWIDYPNPGYRPDDLQRAIYGVTGWDCTQFFDRYVEGLVEPPFLELLPQAGLKVVWLKTDAPYLGMSLEEGMKIKVRDQTPVQQAGLQTGDKLLAIAGQKVKTVDEVRAILMSLIPGEEVDIRYRRGGSSKTITVEIAERGRTTFRIEVADDLSAEQEAIVSGILSGTPDAI